MEYLEMAVGLLTSFIEQWDGVDDIIISIIGFIETIITTFAA